jgi:hypothetical protein
MSRLADDRRTYHRLFRRRNFTLRALEKKMGRRLDIQEVMDAAPAKARSSVM